MALYMLSTETASCLIRGQSKPLDERIASTVPEELCISAITRGELLCGVSRQMVHEMGNASEFLELLHDEAKRSKARLSRLKRVRAYLGRDTAGRRTPSSTGAATTGSPRRTTHEALAGLTPQETAALRTRFAVGTEAGHTLEKIAKQFEATRERLSCARTQKVSRVVEQFLARVSCRPWDEAAATHFARVAAELHQGDAPISTLETMIAGHAIAAGAVLVTTDEHRLSRVAGLKTENWTRRSNRR